MAIAPYRGRFHTEWYPKAASVTFAVNDLVYINTSGYVAAMTDAGNIPLGLIQIKTASTDSDYASNTLVPVLVGDTNAEYFCENKTGTPAVTNIGEWIDVDGATTPSRYVDVGSSTYDIFLVTQIIDTTAAAGSVIAKMAKKSGVAA